MFFDNHQQYQQARINKSLLWEYDVDNFDFKKGIDLVVQRVIERGTTEDFYAMFNLYGAQAVEEAIKKIPSLSQRELEFINNVMGIPYQSLVAYSNMKEFPDRWPHKGIAIRI